MSINYVRSDSTGSDRHVSFSLPLGKIKPQNMEVSEVENVVEKNPDQTDFSHYSYDSNTLPFVKKHKKKWTIKLPWKKKNKSMDRSYSEFGIDDDPTFLEDGNSATNEPSTSVEMSKSMDVLIDDVFIPNARKRRAFSWYGGASIFSKEDSSKREYDSADGILDEIEAEDEDKEIKKKFQKKQHEDKFSSEEKFSSEGGTEHASLDSSEEELKFASDDKGRVSESCESDIVMNVTNVSSDDKIQKNADFKIEKLIPESPSSVKLQAHRGSVPDRYEGHEKSPYFKKSNSLPSLFFKRNKNKKRAALINEEKTYVNYKESNMEPVSRMSDSADTNKSSFETPQIQSSPRNDLSVKIPVDVNSNQNITSESNFKKSKKSSKLSLKSVKKITSASPSPSQQSSKLSSPQSSKLSSQQSSKLPPQQSLKSSPQQISKLPPQPNSKLTPQQSSKSSKLAPNQFSKSSKIAPNQFPKSKSSPNLSLNSLKKTTKQSSKSVKKPAQSSGWFKNGWNIWDDFNKRKSSSNDSNLSESSFLRIRRKSYEEMINLMEEEMFDDWSDEDDSSDTDGDEIDFSFNKRKLETGYDFQAGSDSKSKENSKANSLDEIGKHSSSDEAELVLKVKISPLENPTASTPTTSTPTYQTPTTQTCSFENKISPNIKRPSAAPPLPPSGDSVTQKEVRHYLDSSDFSDEKMNIEKQKKKRLRKRKTCSDSENMPSLEETFEPLYENVPSKGREKSLKIEDITYALKEKARSSNSISSSNAYDSDSPPEFIPSNSPPHEDLPTKSTIIYPASKSQTMFPSQDLTMGKSQNVNSYKSVYSTASVGKELCLKKDKAITVLPSTNFDPANLPIKTIQSVNAFKQIKSSSPPSPPLNPPPEHDPFESFSSGVSEEPLDNRFSNKLLTSFPVDRKFRLQSSNLHVRLPLTQDKNSESSSVSSSLSSPPQISPRMKNNNPHNTSFGYEKKDYFVPQTNSISSRVATEESTKLTTVSFTLPSSVKKEEINYPSKTLPTKKIPVRNPLNVDASQYPQSVSTVQSQQSVSPSQYPQSVATSQYPHNVATTQYSQSGANTQYPQNVATSQYPLSVVNSQYPQSVATTQYPQIVAKFQYPQSVSTSQHLQSGATSKYPQSGVTFQYPHNVDTSLYLQSVSTQYPQSVSTSQYPQSVATSQYPQSVATVQYPQSVDTYEYNQGVAASLDNKTEKKESSLSSYVKDGNKITWSELFNEHSRPSPMIQRQVLAMKQEALRLADYKNVVEQQNKTTNYKKEAEILTVSKALSMTSLSLDRTSKDYSRGNVQPIHIASTIPKSGYPLKSILRNSNKSMYQTPRLTNDSNIPCTCKPDGVNKTNVSPRNEQVVLPTSQEPVINNKNSYERTQSFTADQIERVKIDDSSSSESDYPPSLPSFPPPPPRYDTKKQRFFETLVQQPFEKAYASYNTAITSSTPLITQSSSDLSNYNRTPEYYVDLELEPIYQNVIYASEV